MKETQSIDRLAYQSAFGASEQDKITSRTRIRELAREKGITLSSIHGLYMAAGRGEVSGFSVPACNIRALTYDTARIVFRLLKKINASAFIFEIARGELGYTDQTADEYAASILAAAVAEEWKGPVFIQADHSQFSAPKFKATPEVAINDLKVLIKKAVEAGFYNIDIDASTLVDLDQKELDAQQANNYKMTALLTRYIREIEPEGVTISVGGEIGHIGGRNSTVSEFEAFMEGLRGNFEGTGLSKVSVQTGTSHGGTLLADGTMAKVNLDFEVLRTIGKVAREKYGLGGAVQHGASTLPLDLFDQFPKAGTIEVHLATGFQNIIFDNVPPALREKMHQWVLQSCAGERKPGVTDEQFIYKTRKKANKPFKKELWDLPETEKKPVLLALEKEFSALFSKLNIANTREVVEKFVK